MAAQPTMIRIVNLGWSFSSPTLARQMQTMVQLLQLGHPPSNVTK
jgi:hypothetical protein